jgi:hypothetical protein
MRDASQSSGRAARVTDPQKPVVKSPPNGAVLAGDQGGVRHVRSASTGRLRPGSAVTVGLALVCVCVCVWSTNDFIALHCVHVWSQSSL